VQGLWALQGTDARYLDPSEDHYQRNLYHVPKTQAYRISGSAELFPQHCQVPNLSNTSHLKALSKELKTSMGLAIKMHKWKWHTFIQQLCFANDDTDTMLSPQRLVSIKLTLLIELIPLPPQRLVTKAETVSFLILIFSIQISLTVSWLFSSIGF
jgi:hypothetical protein